VITQGVGVLVGVDVGVNVGVGVSVGVGVLVGVNVGVNVGVGVSVSVGVLVGVNVGVNVGVGVSVSVGVLVGIGVYVGFGVLPGIGCCAQIPMKLPSPSNFPVITPLKFSPCTLMPVTGEENSMINAIKSLMLTDGLPLIRAYEIPPTCPTFVTVTVIPLANPL